MSPLLDKAERLEMLLNDLVDEFREANKIDLKINMVNGRITITPPEWEFIGESHSGGMHMWTYATPQRIDPHSTEAVAHKAQVAQMGEWFNREGKL